MTNRERLELWNPDGEFNPCHTIDPLSPMSRQPGKYRIDVQYNNFMDYYTYCKGTGWQPRHVTRGQHRGFEMRGRPAEVVEQMAQVWDAFAKQQKFRCFPVPRMVNSAACYVLRNFPAAELRLWDHCLTPPIETDAERVNHMNPVEPNC